MTRVVENSEFPKLVLFLDETPFKRTSNIAMFTVRNAIFMAKSACRSRPIFAIGSRLFSETPSSSNPPQEQSQEQGDPEVIDFIKKV